MKILWLCNMVPAFIAATMKQKKHYKEGWILGAYEEIKKQESPEVAFAFPVSQEDLVKTDILRGEAEGARYYGFYEDTEHPEKYDKALEASLGLICEEYHPDVIHCYGTEFPHTRAMLRVTEWRDRVMIHIQGVMSDCAKQYFGMLPERVIKSVTFRDRIKKDSIASQKEKYLLRAANEEEALKNVRYVCGRTEFDKNAVAEINPSCRYFSLNETVRNCFYEGRWSEEKCIPHSIFMTQGNIPLKGLHVMLDAMPSILEHYPDTVLEVAGDDVVRGKSLKDRIKLPAYGKYLKELIEKNGLKDRVKFLGPLSATQIKKKYLSCNVFVLPSFIENSPNSLGEAMLLGVPVVASETGGIPSLVEDGKEVLLTKPGDIEMLAERILDIFDDGMFAALLGENAAARAALTHDRIANYKMLTWIYEEIMKENS
ncbi:MAG: glycosyltransferase family 4 protein [Lachnospiraceae bacterium]|nr:glycosyltransferase family 4 protein [Lachnospiraceae bacterium]